MAADFDPYHKWLGIPRREQPPHHYRLLGIDLFEGDPEVIEAAANRQMNYLHEIASGADVEAAQKLLKEITQARLCLLDPQRRGTYDADLQAKQTAPASPPPLPAQPRTATAAAAPEVAAVVVPQVAVRPQREATATKTRPLGARRTRQPSKIGIVFALVGLAIACGAIAFAAFAWQYDGGSTALTGDQGGADFEPDYSSIDDDEADFELSAKVDLPGDEFSPAPARNRDDWAAGDEEPSSQDQDDNPFLTEEEQREELDDDEYALRRFDEDIGERERRDEREGRESRQPRFDFPDEPREEGPRREAARPHSEGRPPRDEEQRFGEPDREPREREPDRRTGDDQPVAAALRRAKQEFRAAAEKSDAALKAAFEEAVERVARTGEREAVQRIRAEQEAYQSRGALPKSKALRPATVQWIETRQAAMEKLIAAYERAIGAYTENVDIARANELEREMKEFAARESKYKNERPDAPDKKRPERPERREGERDLPPLVVVVNAFRDVYNRKGPGGEGDAPGKEAELKKLVKEFGGRQVSITFPIKKIRRPEGREFKESLRFEFLPPREMQLAKRGPYRALGHAILPVPPRIAEEVKAGDVVIFSGTLRLDTDIHFFVKPGRVIVLRIESRPEGPGYRLVLSPFKYEIRQQRAEKREGA